MHTDEMILISVADCLVKPPTPLEGRLLTEGAVSLASLSAKLNV